MPSTYSLTMTLKGLFREKWINLLSVLTIAAGLFIISIAVFAVFNIRAATRNLPERFSIMLYLEDNVRRENIEGPLNILKKNKAVASVRFISKESAMKELKAVLKDSDSIFEGLDENPLPDSAEIKLKKQSISPEAVKKLAEDALSIPGVKEVDYGEKFLSALHSLEVGMNTIGTILIAVLSTGIVFVCYSTVKILFYRRNDEIETFKLLGATRGFIRTPFLIEGAILGGAGGLISLIGIFAFHRGVIVKLSGAIPLFGSLLFPARVFLSLPLAGLILGVAGAAIAIGRIRY